MRDVMEKIVGAFKWLVDNAKTIAKVLGGLGGAVTGTVNKLNPFGDAADASVGQAKAGIKASAGGAAAGKAFNVGPQLWDEIGMGQAAGLHVSSGYRPGATTRRGTPSDHGANPAKAVDMAGPAQGKAALFKALIGRGEIAEAFYDPLGSIFNGVLSSYREGGHTNHIHIAEYDSGGLLPPGLTLALNRTGRPETILPPSSGGGQGRPMIVQLQLDGRTLAELLIDPLRNKAQIIRQQTGRPAFG
jgi:hypothetical protein